MAPALVVLRFVSACEAHAPRSDATRDHLVQTDERSSANEEDVGRIYRRELLMRMLAPTLRRNVRDRTLQDFEQRLLDAFTRDVAGDRRVLIFPTDLVDLVDVDDA